MVNSTASDVLEKLAALVAKFHQQLPDKIDEIDKLWNKIIENKASNKELVDLHLLIHSLAGSGGTFGATAISHLARDIEQIIKPLINQTEQTLSSTIQRQISRLLSDLKMVAITWQPSNIPNIEPAKLQNDIDIEKINKLNEKRLIYITEDDELLAIDLATKLEHVDYKVQCFSEINDFENACEKEMPSAIIMDLMFKEGEIAGAEVISRLKKEFDVSPPVIFISVRNDIEARLAATRAGAIRYFCKPLDIEKLVQTLDGLTKQITIDPYKVMIVDDEPTSLTYATTILTNAGIEVKALSLPMKALDSLYDFEPDLVILDIYMPECSGSELAQVIRQDDTWSLMPIIFLSAESVLHNQLAAMNLGGDDFLVKPVTPDYLVAAVLARIKRARWSKRFYSDLQSLLRESRFQTITMDQHAIVSSADAKGIITSVNDKFCEISGYSREELIGQNHRLIKSDVHDKSFYKDLWGTIASGHVWKNTVCNFRKNGERYWVETTIVPFLNDRGKPYKYVSARTDITTLRETEERLTFAVEGAGDGIWDWNIDTGSLSFSGCYESMLGFCSGELKPDVDTWKISIHPDDYDRVQSCLKNYLAGFIPFYSVKFRLYCKDGSYKWILCRGAIVSRNNDNVPVRMIGIHTDISKQVEDEQALISARKEAEAANSAKSQFLASMSHELRTPLNAVMGFSQLLQMNKKEPLTTSQEGSVQEIFIAGKHLLELINEILDLSKIESGNTEITLERVVLGEVIYESLQLIAPLTKETGITIQLYRDGIEVAVGQLFECQDTVMADLIRLKQVLINLLGNAIKYNRKDGKIIISFNQVDNNQTRISITDTGLGLTTEQQTKLFIVFNRLGAENSNVEGTGIGLVISKKFTELMNGNIGVESQVNVGSTFWIELPNGSNNVKQASDSDSDSDSDNDNDSDKVVVSVDNESKQKGILYIEDNQANLMLVKQLIEIHTDFQIYGASEPILGIKMAIENQPCLILLDINLPEMSGFEVIKKLHLCESTCHIPVIAISADAMQKTIEDALLAGFSSYITKPIDINALLQAINEALL